MERMIIGTTCVEDQSRFGTPWIPKSGPHASPSPVDQKDDLTQQITDRILLHRSPRMETPEQRVKRMSGG
jgi:hypothetical protein